MTSWGTKRILQDNGTVTGAELIQCASVFDEDGNFCPAFNELTEKVVIDQVILAIGQASDLSFIDDNGPLKVEGDLIAINPETLETGMPGVFSGGDVGKGPGAIIDAIAAGRKAASSIDKFLGGDGTIDNACAQRSDPRSYAGKREKGFADLKRVENPMLPISERFGGFPEVELCFSDEHAIGEAKRCLQCDLELIFGKNVASQEKKQ
jgi:NADH-quinone oxidoreductase subunit F